MRIFFSLLFFVVTNYSIASELNHQQESYVFAKTGNIYYAKNSEQIIQLTNSGKDSSPLLSSNKKIIAFIRASNHLIPEGCDANTDNNYGNQIWLYDLSTKKERLLVANNFDCDTPEKKIVDPMDLAFSPDNKKIYFITSAWTTSGALHVVNIATAEVRYITSANEFKLVSKGEDKGSLIVYQHRYFIGGGTYDWYWLFSPEGKEEGPIGPEITKEKMDFIES